MRKIRRSKDETQRSSGKWEWYGKRVKNELRQQMIKVGREKKRRNERKKDYIL